MDIRIGAASWTGSCGGWTFRSAVPRVEANGGIVPGAAPAAAGGLRRRARSVEVALSVEPRAAGSEWRSLAIDLHNRGRQPAAVDRVVFLSIARARYPRPAPRSRSAGDALRMLVYNDSMIRALPQLFDNGSRPYRAEPEADSDVRGTVSRLFTAIYRPADGAGFCAAFIPDKKRVFNGYFELAGAELTGAADIGVPLEPGARVRVGRLLLYAGEGVARVLRSLPDAFGPARKSPGLVSRAGWNSWDYYLWYVSLRDILEAMRAIRRSRALRNRIRYIVIDGGWSHANSDWQANYRFPGGLRAAAARIRAAGFVPGIWTAPFLVSRINRLMAEHPEWILKNDRGAPVMIDDGFEKTACLDPSHPAMPAYLGRLYRSLRRCGFGYFKIDFLLWAPLALAQGGRPANLRVTLLEAIRAALRSIRTAIGPKSVLLGCGGFFPEIGAGLYDACRASVDISSYWSNILTIARDMAVKSLFAGKVWQNDYDFLIVRSAATACERRLNVYRDLNTFVAFKPYRPFVLRSGPAISSENEVRAWASLILVSGGSLVLADRLRLLNARGRRILNVVLRYSDDTPGRPLDLLSADIPRVWYKSRPDGGLLAVFNWTDRASTLPALALEALGIRARRGYELWSGEAQPLAAIAVAARDAKVFHIRSDG